MFPPPLPGLYGDGPGSCITWAIHGPVEGYHTLYDPFGASVYSGEPGCTKVAGMLLIASGCFWMLRIAYGCGWVLLDAYGCF